jgi:hypothetical protein
MSYGESFGDFGRCTAIFADKFSRAQSQRLCRSSNPQEISKTTKTITRQRAEAKRHLLRCVSSIMLKVPARQQVRQVCWVIGTCHASFNDEALDA